MGIRICNTLLACILCIPVSSSLEVPIGLVVDSNKFDQAQRVAESAISDVRNNQKYLVDLKLASSSTGTPGCGTGSDVGTGAYLLFDDFYKYGIKAIFGPTCYKDLEISGRATTEWDIIQFNIWQDHPSDIKRNNIVQMTTKSSVNIAYNLRSFLKAVSWTKVAIFFCSECYDDPSSLPFRIDQIQSVMREGGVDAIYRGEISKNFTSEQYIGLMELMKTTARVFIPFLGPTWSNYIPFARAMNVSELSKEEYVAVYIMIYYQYYDIQYPWESDVSLAPLFDGSVMMFNDFFKKDDVIATSNRLGLSGVDAERLLLYLQLYESIFVYAYALGRIPPVNGTSDYTGQAIRTLLMSESINGNGSLHGPFGELYFDKRTIRLTPFLVKIMNGVNMTLDPMVNISIAQQMPCINESTTLAGGLPRCYVMKGDLVLDEATIANLPQDIPTCGFHGESCDQTGTVIIIAAVMTAVLIAIGVFLVIRKMKTGETASMPWAIPISSVKMVDIDAGMGSQQMSIHSLQQHIENKTKMREMLRTRQLATIDQAYVVIESYNLKERLVFDKSDLHLLYLMKQAVHDNLNPFMGLCFDRSQHLYVMWSHCFRGTLADMIFETKKDDSSPAFDKNFKGAFVRDLLKGLDFIHSSHLGFHGTLTPSQCLIDSHWILKLSGFGMSRMLYRWKNNSIISTLDGSPLIPNSDLHYYAPEIRRSLKALMYTNRNEHIQLTNKQGQSADMFAFGMVLFEIVFRKKCVDVDETLQSEEDNIIMCEQAEAQIPVYPTVPDDHDVHPDLIGVMHRCWSGQVEQRPDATLARKITDATLKMSGSLVDQMIKNMEQYTNNLENLVKERTGQLEEEQKKAEALLTELLPKSVADELKIGRRVDAKSYKSATILYSDIVGFTSMCSESQPMEVVALLSGMFQRFDMIITQHNASKIETIGDAYMVASGVPTPNQKDHVRDIASVALQQREFLYEFEIPHRPGQYLHCRWGFNTGGVFTGVVGQSAPRYCVFGETVTLAAKMENSGLPDKIQMSFASYKILSERYPEFKTSKRDPQLSIPPPPGSKSGSKFLLTYWLDGVEDLLRSDRQSYKEVIEEEERKIAAAGSGSNDETSLI